MALQSTVMQWTKSNWPCNCRSATTLCALRVLSWLRLKNNSVQSLYRPATSQAAVASLRASNTFAWVVHNNRYHTTTKSDDNFFLHAQEEAIAMQDQKGVCPNSWGCPFIKSVIRCARGYANKFFRFTVFFVSVRFDCHTIRANYTSSSPTCTVTLHFDTPASTAQ